MMLDVGSTLDNISIILGISTTIIPTIITLVVIIILIYLTFKMQMSGLLSVGILIALYTVSMAVLTFLNINSTLNIFSLFGDTLATVVITYGH